MKIPITTSIQARIRSSTRRSSPSNTWQSSLVSLLASSSNSPEEILLSRLENSRSHIFTHIYFHYPSLSARLVSLSRCCKFEQIFSAKFLESADPHLPASSLFPPLFASLLTPPYLDLAMPFFPRSSSDALFPLLNSASPWASTFEDLKQLWNSPHTQAITTRTATLDGYPDDPTKHQVRSNPHRNKR